MKEGKNANYDSRLLYSTLHLVLIQSAFDNVLEAIGNLNLQESMDKELAHFLLGMQLLRRNALAFCGILINSATYTDTVRFVFRKG